VNSPDCAEEVVPAIVDQGVELDAPHNQTVIACSSLRTETNVTTNALEDSGQRHACMSFVRVSGYTRVCVCVRSPCVPSHTRSSKRRLRCESFEGHPVDFIRERGGDMSVLCESAGVDILLRTW
jgi:hypothetical protein